jgi:diguanylate cyclase (GGDEF)-like protein
MVRGLGLKPVRLRRRGATAAPDGPEIWDMDPRLGARALGWLFVSGATIGLLSLLLPHPPEANVGGLYLNIGLAGVGGAALLLGASHVRVWALHVALALGTLLIARAVVLSGDAVSFYSVWFIWVGLYAFYFFRRRVAGYHVAFVAILYAATLANRPPSSPIARWLTTIATLTVAGIFIDTLVRHARRQASAAAASARSMGQVVEMAHELAGISDGDEARLALCNGAVGVTGAHSGALWEPSDDRTSLVLTAATSLTPVRSPVRLEGPQTELAQAFISGRPTRSRSGADGRPGHPVAWLWQPIVREQLTVAVFELGWEDTAVLEDASAIVLANLLAVEVAVTLQRVQLLADLETTARTDELTGLPNRRAWREQLPLELTQATSSNAPLSVAILDLDHFKRFNDTRGHQTGDRLLKEVAGVWTNELRPADILARYGGEEFALALPACPLDEALVVVERLHNVMPRGQSCSAGIACWDGSETTADLLGRADHALYKAKRGGRNQSAVAPGPAQQPQGDHLTEPQAITPGLDGDRPPGRLAPPRRS